MKKGIVYLLTNTTNGKPYVGATTATWKRRWSFHRLCARQGDKRPLYDAIRADGPVAFSMEVLAHTNTQKQLDEMEIVWIFLMDSKVPNGYNMTEGGKGHLGFHPSEETRKRLCAAQHNHPVSNATRRKISHAAKRRYQEHPEYRLAVSKVHKGKIISPEQRQNMRDSQLGRKHTEADLKKMRGPRTGKALENIRAASKAYWKRFHANPSGPNQKRIEAMHGASPSAEIRQKISLAAKARWADPKQRRKLTSAIQRGWKQKATK
jgi:group I intron endonuclease